MARSLGGVCRICRREGMKLYLKGSRCDSPKCGLDRRNNPPGMHGYRRGKPSEYGVRLREKQKLKRFYSVDEAQFRRFFSIASRSPANTGEVLLSLMERRLDNIVHRLGFAVSRGEARQLITHGHIQVNGKTVSIPSYVCRAGETISVTNRPRSLALVRIHLQDNPPAPPDFLERTSTEPPAGKVLRLPERADVDPHIGTINEQLIIELSAR